MPYDLSNGTQHLTFSINAWSALLRLAQTYGAEIRPEYGYQMEDVVVDAEDAADLADALELALPGIPDQRIMSFGLQDKTTMAVTATLKDGTQVRFLPPFNLDAATIFAGYRDAITDLIEFLRSGEFTVW